MKSNRKELSIASSIKRHILKHRVKHASFIYLTILLVLVGFRMFGGGVGAYGCVANGDLVISTNTTWSTNQCYDNVVVTNEATLTIVGGTVHEMTSLSIGTGSGTGQTGTIVVQGDSVSGSGVELRANNVEVKNGSKISADGQGYPGGQGPGGSATGGASHGGLSANGSEVLYGSIKEPVTLGSGSGSWSGGGAIKLTVDGDLLNNGGITANGSSGSSGGSGGSVWVNFTGSGSTWSGSGSFQAYGGLSYYEGGGGGRIAVTGYTTDTHTGSLHAGGGGYTYHSNPVAGLPGTVFTRSVSQTHGTLLYSNGGATSTDTRRVLIDNTEVFDEWIIMASARVSPSPSFTLPASSTMTLMSGGSLNIGAGQSFYLAAGSSLITQSNSTINNISTGIFDTSAIPSFVLGGKLVTNHTATNVFSDNFVLAGVPSTQWGIITHPANNSIKEYWLDLDFNNLAIEQGGKINADYAGFAPGYGPGGSITGAASYGGPGATGSTTSYGLEREPIELGSGSRDASGGGAVKLNIAGNFVNNGSITANGNDETSGASGGSVWVNFTGAGSVWSGTGYIYAVGGLSYSEGGGGGRIAVTGYTTDSHTGSLDAKGGGYTYHSSPVAGLSGSIFMKSTAQTYGTLYTSNGAAVPVQTRETVLSNDTYDQRIYEGNARVKNAESFTLPSGSTMRINGGASLNLFSGQTLNLSNGSTTNLNSAGVLNIGSGASTVLAPGATFNSNAGSFINNISEGTFDSSALPQLVLSGTLNTSQLAMNNFSSMVTIQNNGRITHPANADSKVYWLDLDFENLTINSNGAIDVSGKGYAGGAVLSNGYGPGAGQSGGSGAGHGGMGGNSGPTLGGVTYGAKYLPVELGSGGGGGVSSAGVAGGGVLNLRVGGTLLMAGSISSNGESANSGGAGSGGSLIIDVGIFNCAGGNVSANGGGSNSGGAGGGGRITYKADLYTGCSSMTANGASLGTVVNIPNTPINLALQSRTTTSLTWVFEERSFSETDFKLYDGDGNEIAMQVSTTTLEQGPIYTFVEENFAPNTTVTRYVTAINADAESLASASVTANTLADTPGAPTVNYYTNSSFRVIVDPVTNSAQTTFAIKESSTNTYVQGNGSLGPVPVWKTYNAWGGEVGLDVVGLSTNTLYAFSVKANSADNVETEMSGSMAKHTLAVVPSDLAATELGVNSLRLTFGVDDNPPSTEFTILESGTSLGLQPDGTLGQNLVWGTYVVWGESAGKLVTGLTQDTEYVFTIKARNGDGIDTDTVEIPVSTFLPPDEPPEEPPEPPEPPVLVAPPTAPKTASASDLAKILGLEPFNLARITFWVALSVSVSVGTSKLLSRRKKERV